MVTIIGEGTQRDPRSLPLFTRKRRHIKNVQDPEIDSAKMMVSLARWKKEKPLAKLRSATGVYNCMGLVFASRRTIIPIEPEVLNIIREDDEYREFTDSNKAQVGDLVLYCDEAEPTHIGVIVEMRIGLTSGIDEVFVLSKWGEYGEYLHPLKHVPEEYGEPKVFWTERRLIT